MITAVAGKLKSIIGSSTYGTKARKRTLENGEGSPEEEEPMMEEPSRKRARTVDVGDDVNRLQGNLWKLGNIPRFMSSKASRVITWFTSFTSLPTTSIEEHPDTMLPVVRRKLREDRYQSEQAASNYGSDSRRHNVQGPAILYSVPRGGQEDEEEIKYLGTKSRLERSTPTSRPALSRHSEAPWSKSSKMGTPSISTNFRFSPSVASTATKQTSINNRQAAKEASFLRSSKASAKLNLINRKSMSISRHSPMDFNEKIFGQKKKKGLFNFSSFAKANPNQFEDKMRYKQLLQQFTESPVLPDSHSVYRGFSNSSSNSHCGSLQGLVTRSCLDSDWTNEKRQEIESSTPITIFSPSQRPPIYDSKQKTNGFREGKKSSRRHVPLIDLVQPESDNSNQSLKDSDSDSVVFTNEIKKAEPKTNSLEERLQSSPLYNSEWLKSIRERYEQKGKSKESEAEQATKMKQLLEEKRKAMELSLEDTVELKMKDLDLTFPSKVQEITLEDEEDAEEELVPLTEEMDDVIDDALRRNPPNQVLIEKFNIQITRRDIATLHGLNWLNDEVINFYMNLLMDRGKNDNSLSVYAFNTFFYPKLVKTGYGMVRRWTKKVDIFSQDLLLVPVHLGMHWCLATLDFRSKKIRYYDSMLGDNERCLEALLKYLESEHEDKKKSKYSESNDWTLENVKDIPQQMNGSDCGMFACKFAEYLARDVRISFDQEDMPYFRRRMIYEIVNSQLL